MSQKPFYSFDRAVNSIKQGQANAIMLRTATQSWFKLVLSYAALLFIFEIFYFAPALMVMRYKYPEMDTVMTVFAGSKVTILQWLHYSLLIYLSPIVFLMSREWRVFYAPSFLMTSFVFHSLCTYVYMTGFDQGIFHQKDGSFVLLSLIMYVILSVIAFFKRRTFLERVSFRKNFSSKISGSNVLFVPPGER